MKKSVLWSLVGLLMVPASMVLANRFEQLSVGELTVETSITGGTLSAVTLAGGSLANGKVLVGNASGVAAEVTPAGDVTITSAGATAIGSGVITNTDISATANIAASKLADADLGDVSIASGVVSIDGGVIVNADVNASAGIVGSKLDLTSGTTAATFSGLVDARQNVTFDSTNAVWRTFKISDDFRRVETPFAYGAVTNGEVILPQGTYQVISAAGPVTCTVDNAYLAGQTLRLINSSAQAITITNGGNLALGADAVLNVNDVLNLYATATNQWVSMGLKDN